MIRFEQFEALGVAVAAISERADGDCAWAAQGGAGARRAFCARCGLDAGGLVCARQVHGVTMVRAGEADRGRGGPAGKPRFDAVDAMVTDVAGLPLAVFVADCVPVYFFDPQRRAIGLVHAGREGTRQQIGPKALDVLTREFGSRPWDVHALIGPSAGPCCYEVSPEIAEDFAQAGLPVRGRHVDLWEANVRQLVAAGVPEEQVAVAGMCTICDGRFHSYRRDGGSARNMALLAL